MSRGDPFRVRDYLEHIAEAVSNIQAYTAGFDVAAYLADRKTQDAVVRNFEIIGEACSSVLRHHAAFAASQPQIPWTFAYEMRNALAHGYFRVDQLIVWRTIERDLPPLKGEVDALLRLLPAA